MKSFFSGLIGITALLSLSANVLASDGASCAAYIPDDNSYFSVVGVQGTGVHPRQDIRELEKDTETWNLFLQALARFQAMDQDKKLSYYQVAGIHGAPFGQWDGVASPNGQQMMGYCPHTSSLFGTWHRPYLALFEQILHDCAVDIAMEYPVGEAENRALEIASKVRLPYWDWAVDPSSEGSIPGSLRRQTVKVTRANGTIHEIANPLYRYDFHPLKYDDFAPLSEFGFKGWNHTLRNPLDRLAVNATSRNDEVNERVSKQQPDLRNMLYKLLTTYQPFSQVSNKASGGVIGNFETLHDGLHNVFGLGHMGIVEVSAFDPIFWLHHCNMDRIVAMYQFRYPDTWVEEAKQAMGTYTIPSGSTQGVDSPLTPFHMNMDGDMWTSASSRNWTSFGYTYPEFLDNPSNETFTSTLNKLYKPQTPGLNETQPLLPAPGRNATNVTSQATDWLCEVNMPADIKISYSVRAFLGEPNSDPKNWPTDTNYVGQLASMSSSRMKTDVIVTGSIVLTEKLAQKHRSGELRSLDKADVGAYLKANFHWRIQALDFSEIPRNNPPAGLNVTVFNVPVTIPLSDTEVPTWNGDVEYNHDIDGNPPLYNGPGVGGTNVTVPAGEIAGMYNATSGEYEWRNGGELEQSATSTTTLQATSLSTQLGTGPATQTPWLVLYRSPVTSIVVPESTPPAGPRTEYVTEIVYITM